MGIGFRRSANVVLTVLAIAVPAAAQTSGPPAQDHWSNAERWAWKEIRAGRIADFNQRYKKELDPKQPKGWDDQKKNRRLSQDFLKTILMREPFRSVVPDEGVRIIGAWLPEEIDLAYARLGQQLWLNKCRSDGGADLTGATVGGQLSMIGSTFKKSVVMNGLEVKQSLFMSDGNFEGGPEGQRDPGVVLTGATVGGQLSMIGSTFKKSVVMDGLEVKQNLFMRNKATFEHDVVLTGATFEHDVVLTGAAVGSNLEMDGSSFKGVVNMDSLEVKQSLFMRQATFDGDVVLTSAAVGSNLGMDDSSFKGVVNMDSLEVKQSLLMSATFEGDVDLLFAKVGSNLDVGGATFHHSVDLTGTVVTGDLSLGARGRARPQWDNGARLVLRNARVGALQDRIDRLSAEERDAWPGIIQLDGFVYDHLGGFGEEETAKMTNRDTGWYELWIKRDPNFSPQPYQQLTKVFREMGFPEKANDILFAARAQELDQAWARGEPLQWLGLSLLQGVVGYGIGSYAFRVLIWVIGFAVLGTVVLWFSLPARSNGLAWRFGASLDQLLPIVHLNKEFDDFFDDPQRKRLKGWQLAYFAFQAVAGYVLGFFLIAALAGVTQKS